MDDDSLVQFVVIDRCPVPAEIAEQVRLLKHDVPGAVLQSAYRGDMAAGLLKRLGKSTQAMLYAGWVKRLPGFNPANPPGRSTHELRSDGVPYRGPVGRPIKSWGCGLDFNDGAVDALMRAAKVRRWDLFRPYSAGSERHHVNFRRYPKLPKVTKRKARKQAVKVRPTQITKAGVKFIADFEGFRGAPYQDAVKVWTIGFGHTGGVTAKSPTLTRAEALDLLDRDLNIFEAGVAKAVKVRLTPLQFDALVSLAYNVGLGAFQSSTLVRMLNAKRYSVAANEFLRWDKAGGRTLPGLTRRRRAERKMFLKGSSAKTRAAASLA